MYVAAARANLHGTFVKKMWMAKHRFAGPLIAMAAMMCGPALAYPVNPFFTPEDPTTNDAIVFNAYAGPCDLLQYPFVAPVVTLAGDQITVQLSGEHYDNDPILCVLGSRIDQAFIGAVPAGSYAVTVNWRFTASSGFVCLWAYYP